jgi:hypothetical protein
LRGVEKHTASDTDGFQLSGALQPMKRSFTNLQKRQGFGARK